MKIVTIIGARPQFIKAAAFSRAITGKHEEILVHTGQHFDANMSDVFFEELKIPKPKYNLGISGGTHGKMTGAMLAGIEEVLLEEKPDWVLRSHMWNPGSVWAHYLTRRKSTVL